jgi:transcriptional regulator with XRE-family HTH domain
MVATHATIIRPVNTRWFQNALDNIDLSQRKLAKRMGEELDREIDPSAVSLMLRGIRDVKADEAATLAKILRVPLEVVLKNLGVDLPQEDTVGSSKVNVVGWLDGHGKVHTDDKILGPRRVSAPPGIPEGTVALRDQSGTVWDGWVSYYKPVTYLMPDAIGRLCVVEVANGDQFVKVVQRGFDPGTFRLIGVNGADSDLGTIKSASPIIWLKQ